MPDDSPHPRDVVTAREKHRTHHRYVDVNGVSVFLREAGPPHAPVVLLLHGFPTSSRMYRDLIPVLSVRYRVIAPDYPAFGHSAIPDRSAFNYDFDTYATIVDGLLTQLNVDRFAMYVHDFGALVEPTAPIAYRGRTPASAGFTRTSAPMSMTIRSSPISTRPG